MSKRLKSWKIVDKEDGNLQMIIIAPIDFTHKDLNRLIQNGMKCVVLDQRSELVNKELVE